MITFAELTFAAAASLPYRYGSQIKQAGGWYSRSRLRSRFGREADMARHVWIPLTTRPAFHLVDALVLHYTPDMTHGEPVIVFSIDGRPELPAEICRRPWEGCICLSFSAFNCDLLRFDNEVSP